jgi:hypothetical protein
MSCAYTQLTETCLPTAKSNLMSHVMIEMNYRDRNYQKIGEKIDVHILGVEFVASAFYSQELAILLQHPMPCCEFLRREH